MTVLIGCLLLDAAECLQHERLMSARWVSMRGSARSVSWSFKAATSLRCASIFDDDVIDVTNSGSIRNSRSTSFRSAARLCSKRSLPVRRARKRWKPREALMDASGESRRWPVRRLTH